MSTIPQTSDIVVIGGGPSGSVASALLAMDGYSVVLLEKVQHPRNTVGESLIPHFWKYTDLIGATDTLLSDGFIEKTGGLVYWDGNVRTLKFTDFGHQRPALHVERDRFDHILLQNARAKGVQVFEQTAVSRVDLGSDVSVVNYRTADGEQGSVRCRYVVDASGQAAVVSKQLGIREFDPDIRFMSLWGYYEGGDYLTVDGNRFPMDRRREVNPCTVISSIGDWGWAWHIVLRDTVSVGVILPPERLQAFKAQQDTIEARFQGIVAEAPIVGDLLGEARFLGTVHGIRDYAYKPVELVVENCYLTGDAAAFVDPINSAGVVFGMYSGYLSAWSISNSLRMPARRDQFRGIYRKSYGDRLALFRLLAMPSDAAGVKAAIEEAANGVSMQSRYEQALMLSQATIQCRAEGISEILERFGIMTQPICAPVEARI